MKEQHVRADDAFRTAGSLGMLTPQLLAAAVTSAGDAMVITDAAATILWSNPAFTRMTGYSAAEVAGQNPPAPWDLVASSSLLIARGLSISAEHLPRIRQYETLPTSQLNNRDG